MWMDIHPDLLKLIFDRCSFADRLNIVCVGKSWQDIIGKVYPIQKYPSLVYVSDEVINFYMPSWNKVFKVNFQHLIETRLYTSRNGWIAGYKENEVFLFNPINKVAFSYPGVPEFIGEGEYTGLNFQGMPGRRKFGIFCIESLFCDWVYVCFWEKGIWRESICQNSTHDHETSFIMSPNSSPVWYEEDEVFFCIGVDGKLGCYTPSLDLWHIFEKPTGFSVPVSDDDGVHLVVSDDHLMAVIAGSEECQVFQLEMKTCLWELIHDLGSKAVFVGRSCFVVMDDAPSDMCNRVIFNRTQGIQDAVEAKIVDCDGRAFFEQIRYLDDHTADDSQETMTVLYFSLQTRKYSCKISNSCFTHLSSVWYDPPRI